MIKRLKVFSLKNSFYPFKSYLVSIKEGSARKGLLFGLKSFLKKLILVDKKSSGTEGSVLPYSFYRYQKIYVRDLLKFYNPYRVVSGWIGRRVAINRASLQFGEDYYNILPFVNPDKFAVYYHKKPIVFFGDYLQVFQFIGVVAFRYKKKRFYAMDESHC